MPRKNLLTKDYQILDTMIDIAQSGQDIILISDIKDRHPDRSEDLIHHSLRLLTMHKKVRRLVKGVYDAPGIDPEKREPADRYSLAMALARRRGLGAVYKDSQDYAYEFGMVDSPAGDGNYRWVAENHRCFQPDDDGVKLNIRILSNWLIPFVGKPAFPLLAALAHLNTKRIGQQSTLDAIKRAWSQDIYDSVKEQEDKVAPFVKKALEVAGVMEDWRNIAPTEHGIHTGVKQGIRDHIKHHGDQAFFVSQDFKELGGQQTVWNALKALYREGFVKRVTTGIYTRPDFIMSDELTSQLAGAIARQKGLTAYTDHDLAAREIGVLPANYNDKGAKRIDMRWFGTAQVYFLYGYTISFKQLNKSLMKFVDEEGFEPLAAAYSVIPSTGPKGSRGNLDGMSLWPEKVDEPVMKTLCDAHNDDLHQKYQKLIQKI